VLKCSRDLNNGLSGMGVVVSCPRFEWSAIYSTSLIIYNFVHYSDPHLNDGQIDQVKNPRELVNNLDTIP
jgi:hypothetical protein